MAIVQPVESKGGRRSLRVSSPATKETIGELPVATAADVEAAVARARAAQPAWAAKSFAERAKVMYRAVEILRRDQERYIGVIMRETGRSHFETLMMEVFAACDA